MQLVGLELDSGRPDGLWAKSEVDQAGLEPNNKVHSIFGSG